MASSSHKTRSLLSLLTCLLGWNPFQIFSFVGITDDALLAKKRNRDLLEPFDRRRDEVEGFIRMMNPNLKVRTIERMSEQVRRGENA